MTPPDPLPSVPGAFRRFSELSPIASRIRVRSLECGGYEFLFGANRNPWTWVLVIALGIVWTTGTILLVVNDVGLGMVVFFALTEVIFALAALVLFVRATRVIARHGHLYIRTELLPSWIREWDLPASQIHSIQRHMGMQVAGRSVYHIRVRTTDGRVRTAGRGITDKREAAAIADAMSRAVGI